MIADKIKQDQVRCEKHRTVVSKTVTKNQVDPKGILITKNTFLAYEITGNF